MTSEVGEEKRRSGKICKPWAEACFLSRMQHLLSPYSSASYEITQNDLDAFADERHAAFSSGNARAKSLIAIRQPLNIRSPEETAASQKYSITTSSNICATKLDCGRSTT